MTRPATFDEAPPPGTINLGIGQPSADLLPVDLVQAASDAFFADAQPFDLNYGTLPGDPRFLDSLAGFLTRHYGVDAGPETLFLTGGNSQAIDLVSTVFAKPGDAVFVEEPSYFLAFQIFRDHGLEIVSIPVDSDGPDIGALESALARTRPAFFYTIPSFQNPTGMCTTASRRARIVELARRHDFRVVADEVYQLLYYEGPPAAAYGAMTGSDAVVSLGSFSKILAPALRLGWIQTSKSLRGALTANGFVSSGGSINHFASHVVRYAIDAGLVDAHIERLRTAYRARVDAMHAALTEYFDGLATWSRPDGGYFFWLCFDASLDTAALRNRARALETGFQPGSVFSSKGDLRNYLRLSFAHYGEDDIREGVSRLRAIFD